MSTKDQMLGYKQPERMELAVLCGQTVELHSLSDPSIMEEQGLHDQKTWKTHPIPLPDGTIFQARWAPHWCAKLLQASVRFPGDDEARLAYREALQVYKNDPMNALRASGRILALSGWTEEAIEETKKAGEPEAPDGGPSSSGSAESGSDAIPVSSLGGA